MPARALALRTPERPATQNRTSLFHAKMLVTRLEEWCVEAASVDEARALFAAGAGHRCTPGDSIQVEFEEMLED